jgi:hypothetical protein
MIKLYNKASQALIGEITTDQFKTLVDYYEEESQTDQDYWINQGDLNFLEEQGADKQLLSILKAALGDAEDMDLEWKNA